MSRPLLLDKSIGVKHTLSKQKRTEGPLRRELAQGAGRCAQGRVSRTGQAAAPILCWDFSQHSSAGQ